MHNFRITHNLQVHSLNVIVRIWIPWWCYKTIWNLHARPIVGPGDPHAVWLVVNRYVSNRILSFGGKKGGSEKRGGGLAINWQTFLKARVCGNKQIAITNVYMEKHIVLHKLMIESIYSHLLIVKRWEGIISYKCWIPGSLRTWQ